MKLLTTFTAILVCLTLQAQITTGEIIFTTGFSGEIEIENDNVKVTLEGADNRYLSIGFGVTTMSSGGDVVSFDNTGFNDRQFIAIGVVPPTDTQDWTIVSNEVDSGVRTLVVTRPLTGTDTTDFTFDPAATSLDIVWARGSDLTFQNHGGDRGATTVGFTLGLDGVSVAQSVTLFPVPTKDVLTLSLNNVVLDNAIVTVYSSLGSQVLQQAIDHKSSILDVSALTQGVYVLKIETPSGTLSSRFVKE